MVGAEREKEREGEAEGGRGVRDVALTVRL